MKRALPLLCVALLAALLPGCGGGGGTGPAPSKSTIRGRAVNSQGQPVSGASVALSPVGRATRDVLVQTTTDINGNFTLTDVAAGTYSLTVTGTVNGGQTTTVVVTVTVPAGTSLDLTVHIVSTSGTTATAGSIQGQVVDATTGAPVAGATVVAQPVPDDSDITLRTFTDANGNFAFDSVTPGIWELRVSAKHFAASTVEAEVIAGAMSQADISILAKPGED